MNNTDKYVRALVSFVLLLLGFFVLYFLLQTIAYRVKLFSYLGMNLLVISFLHSLAIVYFGPMLTRRILTDNYERKLISILAGIAFFGYINVYNIVFPISLERSFSVRIFVNLAAASNQTLSKAELESLQPKEKIYGLRYKEMSGSGLIRIDGENISLTSKGKVIASVYVFLADVIGYSGGFNRAAMDQSN